MHMSSKVWPVWSDPTDELLYRKDSKLVTKIPLISGSYMQLCLDALCPLYGSLRLHLL